MTQLEELRVIRRIQDGDPEPFELLVKEHQKVVYSLALKMTGNESDAMDASQEAFLRAYLNLAKFNGESRFSVWLYRITYNLCVDMARKKKLRPAVSLTVFDEEEPGGAELDIPDDRYDPARALTRNELRRAVHAAVDQLSPKYRSVVILREFSDLSYEEIAEALSLSPGTVKSRLSRAREKLAKILRDNGTFDPENRHTTRKEGADHE